MTDDKDEAAVPPPNSISRRLERLRAQQKLEADAGGIVPDENSSRKDQQRLPDLKVVSERPARESRKQKATNALESSLKAMTANLLRVVSGAGRPELIAEHVEAFARSFADYSDEARALPDPSLLCDMIVFARMPDVTEHDRAGDALLENSVCRHALQVVASTLLEQEMPRAKAMSELRDAMQMIEDRREVSIKQRRKAQKAMASRNRASSRKTPVVRPGPLPER